MSASACVVFFGISLGVEMADVTLLEERTDPRMVRARHHGLHVYWKAPTTLNSPGFMLVGRKVFLMGPEASLSDSISLAQLQNIIAETSAALAVLNYSSEPRLHIEWLEDQ